MSGDRDLGAPARQETEAERMARLDRDAIGTYRGRRFGGGLVSKRYYQHRNDEPDTRAEPQNKKR